MDFASIRMISDDLEPVVSFYEQVTGVPAIWPAPVFAEVHLPFARSPLAIPRRRSCSTTRPVRRTTTPSSSSSSSMMWTKIRAAQEPGQRVGAGTHDHALGESLHLFRDPDGNLVNLFTPSPRTRSRGSGSRRPEPKPQLSKWLSAQVWRKSRETIGSRTEGPHITDTD